MLPENEEIQGRREGGGQFALSSILEGPSMIFMHWAAVLYYMQLAKLYLICDRVWEKGILQKSCANCMTN